MKTKYNQHTITDPRVWVEVETPSFPVLLLITRTMCSRLRHTTAIRFRILRGLAGLEKDASSAFLSSSTTKITPTNTEISRSGPDFSSVFTFGWHRAKRHWRNGACTRLGTIEGLREKEKSHWEEREPGVCGRPPHSMPSTRPEEQPEPSPFRWGALIFLCCTLCLTGVEDSKCMEDPGEHRKF